MFNIGFNLIIYDNVINITVVYSDSIVSKHLMQ